jgi:hypothetical protein
MARGMKITHRESFEVQSDDGSIGRQFPLTPPKPAGDIRHVHEEAGAAGSADVCRQRRCSRPALSLMAWSREFDDPTLASGDQLAALLDAGNYRQPAQS